MRDAEKVLDICKRLDRTLQRDWGGTGKGISEKLKSAKYTVPPQLYKRIRYLDQLQRKAQGKKRFKLKSSADFVERGEQVLQALAQARKTASRRLLPGLLEAAHKHRLIVGLVVAVLIAMPVLLYLMWEPEPEPVFTPLPKQPPRPVATPAPKPVAKPAPAPLAPPAPRAAASAPAAPVPAPAPASAAKPTPEPTPAAQDLPPAVPAGTQVTIEAPSAVAVTLKRAELVKGALDRDEITVIVEVQNIGYASLKRITFDAWLYDTSGAQPVAVIAPSQGAADATPWHAFLRQPLQRGQSAQVRLNYTAASKWSSDKAIELVKSGRYLIRLKVASLADAQDKTLPR